MSHPHITQIAQDKLNKGIKEFEDIVDNLQMDSQMDVGEEACSILFGLIEVIKHEIALIPVENR